MDFAGRPTGIAVNAGAGRIYLADPGHHNLDILDLQGRLIKAVGKRGSGHGEFNFPTDLDLDAQGNVYVVDSMNARVQVFDGEGKFLRAFGERGTNPGSFMIPKGIAVSAFGQVYVTDSLAHMVNIYDLEGKYLLSIGGKSIAADGRVAPGGFYLPEGIDSDPKGGLWVVDSLNRMIHHFQYLTPGYLSAHPIEPGQAVVPKLPGTTRDPGGSPPESRVQ